MSNPSSRGTRRAAREAQQRNRRLLLIAALVVVVIAVALIIINQNKQPATNTSGLTPGANSTTTASGLQIEDLTVGSGAQAKAGDQVVVNYTGWLPDGTKFDSSLDRNQPFEFTLGAGQVIAGWDEGVSGMQVGGKRRLTIPPELAYGQAGYAGVIPPNATLIFEVELMEIK